MAINKAVNSSTGSHGAMRNCIEYALRDDKVKEGFVEITGPYEYDEINYDKVYQSFLSEKNLWDKDSGRMYAHNIISFHKDENISPADALDFGREFADKWFPNHQTLICIHQDRDHLHIHMVTNTVSFMDGRKLHTTKHDLQKMKNFTNQMCKDRGLSVAEKGNHFDGTDRDLGDITAWSKDSFVVDCALAVLEVLPKSTSTEDFISRMERKGWKVNWTDKRKHITFVNEKDQKVRDSNLNKTFNMNISKEVLNVKFIEQSRARQESSIGTDRLESYYREIENATNRRTSRTTIANNKTTIEGAGGAKQPNRQPKAGNPVNPRGVRKKESLREELRRNIKESKEQNKRTIPIRSKTKNKGIEI